MTTIVGIQGEGFAVIGVDSQVSAIDENGYSSQTSIMRTGTGKIAQVNKYLLGAAGDVRAINLLHHAFHPPAPPMATGVTLDKFMTTKFIAALRLCFDENGYTATETPTKQHAEQNSTIVVVVNAVIYVFENDYSWTAEDSGLYSIGSGATYALGAMSVLQKKNPTMTDCKKLALRGLATASKWDAYTGSPFKIHIQEKT